MESDAVACGGPPSVRKHELIVPLAIADSRTTQGRPAKIAGPVTNFNLGPDYSNNITKVHFIATSIKYVNIMIVYVALTHFFNVLC